MAVKARLAGGRKPTGRMAIVVPAAFAGLRATMPVKPRKKQKIDIG